ncbi:hypothetical protein C8J57DRAFT_1513734 [Mycena rebaudengoi]|nr:hypothetical protein C8J57DRAFT_1513734 [Mycena rebaudengoi]
MNSLPIDSRAVTISGIHAGSCRGSASMPTSLPFPSHPPTRTHPSITSVCSTPPDPPNPHSSRKLHPRTPPLKLPHQRTHPCAPHTLSPPIPPPSRSDLASHRATARSRNPDMESPRSAITTQGPDSSADRDLMRCRCIVGVWRTTEACKYVAMGLGGGGLLLLGARCRRCGMEQVKATSSSNTRPGAEQAQAAAIHRRSMGCTAPSATDGGGGGTRPSLLPSSPSRFSNTPHLRLCPRRLRSGTQRGLGDVATKGHSPIKPTIDDTRSPSLPLRPSQRSTPTTGMTAPPPRPTTMETQRAPRMRALYHSLTAPSSPPRLPAFHSATRLYPCEPELPRGCRRGAGKAASLLSGARMVPAPKLA